MRLLPAALSLLVLLVAAAPAQARGKLCDERPGTTLAATSVGRVFIDQSGPGDPVLRGCRHRSRSVRRLAVDGDCQDAGSVGQVVASGRFAALTSISCDTVSGRATVLLFDLRSGRDILASSAYTGQQGSGIASVGVSELALNADGALAWVGRTSGDTSGSELHLRRPGTQAPELIASGGASDLTDVAVTAHKLYWLDAGAPRTADL